MPTMAATGKWYKSDFISSFGDPVEKYTLDDIIQFDKDHPNVIIQERNIKSYINYEQLKKVLKLKNSWIKY